jgi:hypothetical protein
MANTPIPTPDPIQKTTSGSTAAGPSSSQPTQFTDDQLRVLFDTATQQAFRSSGAGNYYSLYQTILSQYDRFGVNALLPNHEVVGYTFITRPKLNLSTTSLRQDRVLAMFDTFDNKSLQFAVRCYLDTYYSGRSDIIPLATACPFFNIESPFIIPLSNNLVSVAGWPDPVLDTETTDGGFFSEDMTMVKGSDRLNRTYDITLTFRDIQGGFIIALLYMWIRYIELVVRGDTTAYPEDIAARRINYTCSIYRFVLDPSRQFITKWSKATGCFPKSIPIGNIFNFGEKENFIHSAAQYSVPFTVNKIEIMDPIIFRDFNTIARRFSPTVQSFGKLNGAKPASLSPDHNFIGLPYIDTEGGFNKLDFLAYPTALDNPLTASWDSIKAQLAALVTNTNRNVIKQPAPNFTDNTVFI